MPSMEEFDIYTEALDTLERSGIPCVVGGGIAVAAYGRKRATKDIDLYIKLEDTARAMEALRNAGFDINPLEGVHWLAKAYKKGVPIDFILENIGSVLATDETIRRGQYRCVQGYMLPIMSPEDLVFRKVLAMRCYRDDWYDCIAVLSNTYKTFDWDYFLQLMEKFPERALSFVLFVKTDWDHVIPVPERIVSSLIKQV